jgi:hypothetical protein
MTACAQAEHPSTTFRWIDECEGFEVAFNGARLGVVEEIVCGEHGEVRTLLVRGGLFGTTRLEVPVDEIVAVEPRRLRIVVRRTPDRFRPEQAGEESARARVRRALWSR